jgi:hypothetical protein
MNANELADLVDKQYAWLETKTISTMLRQQQAEIEALKAECKRLSQWLVQVGENK